MIQPKSRMNMQNDSTTNGHDSESRERAAFTERVAEAVIIAWEWRKFIAGVTVSVAVLSVAISLLLPKWYMAEARVLPPEDSGAGGIAAAMLRNLPGAASSLLGAGGGAGDYTRYLTILTSRQMLDSVIEEFDLHTVYKTHDNRSPWDDAREELAANVEFEIDNKYDFLSITVLDKSPERAAAMANFFVARLNEVNADLTSSNAANFRRYTEQRYNTALASLDSTLDAVEVFQREFGLIDLPAQSVGFFEQVGTLRAEAVRAEVEFEALREQFGDTNPRVLAAKSVVDAANRTYHRALSGAEATLPVSLTEMPGVIRRYADLERERILQTRIIEVIAPMYEQARFDEEREIQAVQVIDYATPPVLKAKPRRSLLVIASTFSAFLLAVAYVIASTWWRSNSPRFTQMFEAQRPVIERRKAAALED